MALLIVAASLLALAHALGPQASCTVGQQCAAGEQDDTGMLQKSSRMMQVNRHEQMSVKTTPTNDPCRYNTTGCYSAALAQQKVRTTPTNDAECEAVPGINTDEPIVYDSTAPLVLLRGPAVQVQHHGLLLRSLGAAEGEDDAHERCRVRGRAGHQHGRAHRVRL
ncbi:unnamed protein product [Prorocentrum cordatum]|uniref:Uncharacterized protein n=1 Tax=Prorocentrum cordatum TaxID=2364126 RepID=A0ABN9RQX8_9DINO|nr:unnamed protein product [Polarella glacialis]